MSTADTATTQGTTATGQQQGWFAGPVSRGLALVLLAANLAVLGLIARNEAATLERIEMISGSQPSPNPLGSADPELCWLVGSLAYASGQGEKFKTVLGPGATDTSCATDAMRGAAGVNR